MGGKFGATAEIHLGTVNNQSVSSNGYTFTLDSATQNSAAIVVKEDAVVDNTNNGKGQVACTMEAKLCPDGVTYVGRTGPNCEFAACPQVTPPPVSGKCFIGGCSSEICSGQAGAVSSCIYKAEYACYKTAKCERQSDGACGWTATTALKTCINNSSSDKIAAGYVSGHVTIGPNCPVEQVGKPCPPPPEAYSSRQAVIYYADGITIRDKTTLDSNGNYKIALGPGNYFAQIQPAGIGPGEKKSFTVISFQTTTVDFNIDTGIR